MSVETVHANHRPTRLSGGFSVLLGVVALLSIGADGVASALVVELAGVLFIAGGFALHRSDWRLSGSALVVSGVAIVLGAIGFLWLATRDLLVTAQFAPGMLGLAVLALGVIPARGSGSRRLVKGGTAFVVVSVFVTGIVQKPSLVTLLAAGVATVLAWDLGENAIGLGVQLGRRAGTRRAEAVHALGSVAVGLVAILAGRTVDGVGSPGLPIGVFALLVIGLVVLAGALHE